MAHFAQLDDNNVVTRVIAVSNAECVDSSGVEREELGVAFCEGLFGGRWKQTSYNGSIRKNYAGVGHMYDAQLDAFISPRPYPSWTLDAASCQWKPPVAYPTDGGKYQWHELSESWRPVPARE